YNNYLFFYLTFFFFSSRRRHTRWPRDWSSDVCSSDLHEVIFHVPPSGLSCSWNGYEDKLEEIFLVSSFKFVSSPEVRVEVQKTRSEERRVGKECRSRWSPYN